MYKSQCIIGNKLIPILHPPIFYEVFTAAIYSVNARAIVTIHIIKWY